MKASMRSLLLLALGLGLLAGSAPSFAQTVKIGVFSAQRLTQDTAEGAKIQARLNAIKDRKTAELKKLQEELETLQQEFIQGTASASEDRRKDMTLKIQRKQDEMDSAQKAATRELQLEVEAAETEWQRRVLAILADYGREKGFTLIVPADVAAYFNPAIDVTEELVKLVDSHPAEAAKPVAGATPKPADPGPKQPPAPKQ